MREGCRKSIREGGLDLIVVNHDVSAMYCKTEGGGVAYCCREGLLLALAQASSWMDASERLSKGRPQQSHSHHVVSASHVRAMSARVTCVPCQRDAATE